MAQPFSDEKAQQQPANRPARLEDYSVEDLVALRERIDSLLPTQSLKAVNMERELVLQLSIVQKLQRDIIDDDETPANQRAQVAGAVASTLQTLAKLQIELYDSERLKKLEQVLIEVIVDLPDEVQAEFMQRYEDRIAREEL